MATINVMDYGAIGDGISDDLLALEFARAAAAFQRKVLYFPKATYGISDRFMFADGGDAFFEPGATLKLLQNTTSGAAVSGPYPKQTKPIQIINLTIDCSNFRGENGIGFGNIVHAKLINLTVKNCLHEPSKNRFGGKALQFEGAPSTNVQVLGLSIENATVGIDVGAHAPVSAQTVHLSIHDASMKNVDIPVYVNDTNYNISADSYDCLEVLVDGLHCRNCGKLTYEGATEGGGGIFVADRGYKLTARNIQIVNDQGITGGSSDYGGIGAIVRGTWKGLIIEDVLFVGTSCVAVFDFKVSTFQSPDINQSGMYVFAKNIRAYTKLEYVIKGPANSRSIGPCILEAVEVDSRVSGFLGMIDPELQDCRNSAIEIIDRHGDEKNAAGRGTGLRTFKRIYQMGNQLSSPGMLGDRAPSIASSEWTPVDGSEAGLSFLSSSGYWFRIGELIVATGAVKYPVTADTNAAKIGGFPFSFEDIPANRNSGSLTVSTVAGVQKIYPELNTSSAPLLSGTSDGVTNADCSHGEFGFTVLYLALK